MKDAIPSMCVCVSKPCVCRYAMHVCDIHVYTCATTGFNSPDTKHESHTAQEYTFTMETASAEVINKTSYSNYMLYYIQV